LANITAEMQTVTLAAKPRTITAIGAEGAELPSGEWAVLPPYGCVEIVL
jgi:hypothetical protein